MYAGFFDIVNGYTVVGRNHGCSLCLVHGLMFTTTSDQLVICRNGARKLAQKLLIPLAACW